jgi:plastocyanin
MATVAAVIVVGIPVVDGGAAHAATQAVTITASGYVPADVTIQVGDTVSFTNSDSAAHQVEIKPTTGFTCTANPLVVQPAATQSCTFTSAGNYNVSDPNKKGNTFRGSVTVAAPPSANGSITIASSKALVVYGAKVTLSGKVNPVKGGVTVTLLARPFPEAALAKLTTVASAADGTYTFTVPPQVRTEYQTQFADGSVKGTSAVVTVQVRPRVTLSVKGVRGSVATLRTGVVSTINYSGKPVLVQRRNSQGGWTTVKSVGLGSFSARTFTVKAPAGSSRWRVYLQASQAGGGYVASFSPTRVVRR